MVVKKMKAFFFLVLFWLFSTTVFPIEVIKGIFWGHGPLVFDHQDNMYIGYDAHSIVKYSPGGKRLLSIGRKGEGPGDLKRIGSYAFNPIDNTIYVTEFFNGNRRISRFATDGKFSGIWKFEINWSKYDIVYSIDFDKEGSVFLSAQKRKPRRYKDFILTNTVYDLLKFSPGGKYLKKIYSFNTDFDAEKPGNFQATIPFQNALTWTAYRDKIFVKETAGDFITIFSSDGTLEKKIPFPVKRERVTEKDLDAWEKKLKASPFIKKLMTMGKANVNYWREKLPFPKYKPNSSWRMLTDSKGNLYVRGYTGYNKKAPAWFKVDLQTGKIDTLNLKPGEELCRIWKGYFFVYKLIEEEDEEIETIIKIEEKELLDR